MNEEITELKNQNEEKDNKINELNEKIKNLQKELSDQKELVNELKQKEDVPIKKPEEEEEKKEEKKEEDKKVETEEVVEVVEKYSLYSTTNTKKAKRKKKKKNIENDPEEKENDDNQEKDEIIENEKLEIEIKPKVLDMGEEWEIAGKKKKKIEKVKEEPKILNLPKKEEPKNTNDINKSTGSNKAKKVSNQISGDQLVELLRPKKKEIIKNEEDNSNYEVKQVKGKGKKKGKKQFSDIDINLGFKY